MTWLDIPAFSRLRKQPISGANRFFLSQWATTGSDSVWKTLSASQPSQLVHREVRRSNDPSTLEQRFIPSFMNHQGAAVDIPPQRGWHRRSGRLCQAHQPAPNSPPHRCRSRSHCKNRLSCSPSPSGGSGTCDSTSTTSSTGQSTFCHDLGVSGS